MILRHAGLWGALHIWNQVCGRIHRAKRQRVGLRETPLTNPLSGPLREYLLSSPGSSRSTGLEILVPRGGMTQGAQGSITLNF